MLLLFFLTKCHGLALLIIENFSLKCKIHIHVCIVIALLVFISECSVHFSNIRYRTIFLFLIKIKKKINEQTWASLALHSMAYSSDKKTDHIFLILPRKQALTFQANCFQRRQFA